VHQFGVTILIYYDARSVTVLIYYDARSVTILIYYDAWSVTITPIFSLYIFKKQGNLQLFQDMLSSLCFIFHKTVVDSINLCICIQTFTFFINNVLKFKYSLRLDKA
jgi:hypothetical protein